MNYQDALSRRSTLRSEQCMAAGVSPDNVDYDKLEACAIRYDVPPKVAGFTRGQLKAEVTPEARARMSKERIAVIDAAFNTATNALCDITKQPRPTEEPRPSDDSPKDGLAVFGPKLDETAEIAAAVYNGAVVRGRAARWINYAELVVKFNSKISMSAEKSEWEQGTLMDWNFELDSMRYCYDLLVIHGLDATPTTEYVLRELYSLLSIRQGRELYTVVTWQTGKLGVDHPMQTVIKPVIEEGFSLHSIERRTSAR